MNAHALGKALLKGPDLPVAVRPVSQQGSFTPVVIGDPEVYDSVYVDYDGGFGRMAVVMLDGPDPIPAGTEIKQ